ncbi:hypothetical protein ACFE6N_22935 [Pedobacter sp. BG31]|uniref:hypothetical protein n=1 Tax=Pedobacter sp. BG31 TaxID=3349697 RepID=UPI0035F27D1F
MKIIVKILLASFVWLGCQKSKKKFHSSYKIGKGYHIESYNVGLMNNLLLEYLTDSSTFRIYLGTYDDENEIIHCKLKGDTIYVEKKGYKDGASKEFEQMTTKQIQIYSIKKLKSKNIFE